MAKRRTGEAGVDVTSITAGVLEPSALQVAWQEGEGAAVVVKRRARRANKEIESAGNSRSEPVRRRQRPTQPLAEVAPRPPSGRSEGKIVGQPHA